MFGPSLSSAPFVRHWRRRWFLGALAGAGLLGWLARADARRLPRAQARSNAMPAALLAFVDHLIPADDLTPAASAWGVPQAMWREAADRRDLGELVRASCAWLDRYGDDGFASLAADEREALLRWMSEAPWDMPQRRFFHWARERAFTLYYAQPRSWRGLPITRPPQPLGYALD